MNCIVYVWIWEISYELEKGRLRKTPSVSSNWVTKTCSISDRAIELSRFNTIRLLWYFYSTLGERDCDFNSKNYGNIDVADCKFLMK